jgi:uncharacterized protein (UPF0147 family)
MPVIQKPVPKVVKKAAKDLSTARSTRGTKNPTLAAAEAARILDDQKNAPKPHKPAPKPSTKRGK